MVIDQQLVIESVDIYNRVELMGKKSSNINMV